MPSSRSLIVRLFALAAVLATAVGCTAQGGSGTAPSSGGCSVPQGETRTITAGGLISGSYGPVYVADGLGYFKDAGIKVKFINAANPSDALGLLSQGRLDVYLGAPSAGMLNQVEAGAPVRIAAAGGTIGTDDKHAAPSGFYVRKKLADSGEVTEPADIKGRKIGSFGPAGTAVSYYIGLLAESAGLKLKDVNLVSLDPPSAVEALNKGGIDVSYLTAPFSSQVVQRGIAEPLGDPKQIYGQEQAPVIMYGPKMLEEDPATGCAFLAASMRGAEALQGEYWKKPDVAAAFAKPMGVEPDFIAKHAVYNFDPQMKNDPRTVKGMQRMFGEMDLLQYDEPLPPKRVFANDLWKRAVKARASDS